MSPRTKIRRGRPEVGPRPDGEPVSVFAESARVRAPAYAGEPLPEGAAQEQLADMVQAGREEACSRWLGEGAVEAMVEGLRGLMRETSAAWGLLLDQAEFDPPMACKSGCDACCYNPISLTPPEALFLGMDMLDRFDPGRLAEISRRTNQILVHMQGRSRTELALIRHLLPCPLLEAGTCLVHESRPLVCRGWNAVDPEQCRRSLVERDPQILIENHPLPRLLADHFQLGLLKGAHALGLEAGYLALPRALRLLLDHGAGACARDWLRGQPFFGRKRQW